MGTQDQLAQAKQLIANKQYDKAKDILRKLPDNETAQQWLAKLEARPSADVQRRLEQASALIKQKEYAKARTLLNGISDNATAQQWLEKIDKLEGTNAARGGTDLAALRAESDFDEEDDSPLNKYMGIAKDILIKAQIDPKLAQGTFIIALTTGLLAALLDKILGMPGLLIFTFGGFVALLNGPIYATLAKKTDRAAWIMSAVSGLIAMFVWWLVSEIILGRPYDVGSHNFYRAWFDEYTNILKAIITGPIMGLIGLGWQWLMPHLPHDAESLRALVPKRGGE